jgi:hypothetical protein
VYPIHMQRHSASFQYGRTPRLAIWFGSETMSDYGTNRTYREACYLAAFGGKADISQRLANNRDSLVPA